MGEAKRRGTLEQRISEAQKRDQQVQAVKQRRGKSRAPILFALGTALATSTFHIGREIIALKDAASKDQT